MENKDVLIYALDFEKITKFGKGDSNTKTIYCDEIATLRSLITKGTNKDGKLKRPNCHLFNQIFKELGNSIDMSTVLIVMNFDTKNKLQFNLQFDLMLKYNKGVTLTIRNEQGKLEEITFRDFIRSNSMNKESKIYYINEKYFDRIYKRVTVGLNDNSKVKIAKWYAYTGLSASECHILNKSNFNDNNLDEIAIVKDKVTYSREACSTAVSKMYFKDKLEFLKKKFGDYLKEKKCVEDCPAEITTIITNFQSFYEATLDSNRISEDFSIENKTILLELSKINLKTPLQAALSIVKKIYAKHFNDPHFDEDKSNLKWDSIITDNYTTEINAFDGVGLISNEYAIQINADYFNEDINYVKEHFSSSKYLKSFQIRLPFVKGMVHTCDFKQFFKDHNVNTISGPTFNNNGIKEKIYDVNNLKMILTESQFKCGGKLKNLDLDYLKDFITTNQENCSKKFSQEEINKMQKIDCFFAILKMYDYHLGIKADISKKMINYLNYQFWSTFPLNDFFTSSDKEDPIIKENDDYLADTLKVQNVVKAIKADDTGYRDHDKVIYKLNKDFYLNTKRFTNIRNENFQSMKKELILGRLLSHSFRKYLSSDLLFLLYNVINKEDEFKKNHVLKLSNIYIPNTEFPEDVNLNQRFVVLRNPHYTKSEIGILKPQLKDEERDKYFKYLNRVVFINPGSLISNRLGGADYDGDEIIVLYQESLIHKLISNLMKKENNKDIMKYPYINIPSLPANKENITMKSKVFYFKNTFSNKVGSISNFAFREALDKYTNDDDFDRNTIYTILGGLEIDSAKNGKHPELPTANIVNDKSFASSFLKLKDNIKGKNKNNNSNSKQKGATKKTILDKIVTDYKNDETINKHSMFYILNHYYKLNKISLKDKTGIKEKFNYKPLNTSSSVGKFNVVKSILITERIKKKLDHYSNNQNVCSMIINEINEINPTIKISIGIKNMLDFLKVDNIDDKLKIYETSDQKYHYLTNKEEKINYINNVLGYNDIPNYIIDVLTDFSNRGFFILFYCLMYWKYDKESKSIFEYNESSDNLDKYLDNSDDKNTNKFNISLNDLLFENNTDIESFNKDIFASAISFISNGENKFNTNIDQLLIHKDSENDTFIKNFLYDLNLLNNITMDDINEVINIKMNDYVFTIFYDQTVAYFKELKKEEE